MNKKEALKLISQTLKNIELKKKSLQNELKMVEMDKKEILRYKKHYSK